MNNDGWEPKLENLVSAEECTKTWIEQISYSFDTSGVFTEDIMYYGSPNIWSESRKG